MAAPPNVGKSSSLVRFGATFFPLRRCGAAADAVWFRKLGGTYFLGSAGAAGLGSVSVKWRKYGYFFNFDIFI